MSGKPPWATDAPPAHRRPRCHAPDWPDAGDSFELSESESAHLSRVLRLRPGDRVEVFDGAGRSADARIADSGRHRVRLAIESPPRIEPIPAFSGILVQALPKGEKADWIVQKAVELNLARLLFWIAERSEARRRMVEDESKNARWKRIAIAAAKQCGRNRLPDVAVVSGLSPTLEATSGIRRIVCEGLPDARPLRSVLRAAASAGTRALAIHVGPEGGLTADEIAALRAAGAEPASMGPSILRTETAAIAAMCALNYEFSGAMTERSRP